MTSVATLAPVLTLCVALGPSLTSPTQSVMAISPDDMQLGAETDTVAQTALELEQRSVSLTNTQIKPLSEAAPSTSWLEASIEKLHGYGLELDGWKGEGSKAPNAQTISEAMDLLWQFATEVAGIAEPAISADEEGAIYLHWRDPGRVATVSAHGDGTYSYYAENSLHHARSSGNEVGQPLPTDLLDAMIS